MAKSKMMLNNEWGIMFQSMPNENAGKLIKALFSCHEGKEVSIDDPMLSAMYAMMSSIVTENDEKYEERCRKNAENRLKTNVNERKGTSTNDNDRAEIKRNKRKENKDLKEKEIQEKESPAKAEPCMPASREIISYLNEKTGKRYMASSKATVNLIKARLNEGHTVADFKQVIDNKVAEWSGTDMENYLRPETLFAPSHFESYLNQKVAKSSKIRQVNSFDRNLMLGDYDEQNKANKQKLINMQLAGGA